MSLYDVFSREGRGNCFIQLTQYPPLEMTVNFVDHSMSVIACRACFLLPITNNEYLFFAKHTNINFIIHTHGNVKRKSKHV